MSKHALIIFVKNPIESQVKTRLAKTIGNRAAVIVYKQLLQHTLSITQQLAADKFVFYGDFINEADLWPNTVYNKQLQQGVDLGERMKNAFELVLGFGYDKVVIIGSDCYELSQEMMLEAFDKLLISNVVIGPCYDGGYYLLGMKQLTVQLFDNMPWSSSNVLPATVQVLKNLKLKFELLPTLNDVDDEASLPVELKQFI
ncbi:TIGR04282 family arsenosugar biosynthesis glycosyltransferase [Parasediminibacterium paludis]|uniref:TIGR04282 family arsenosugar biosynthesis glycosyltransferase n=1 Tax=Parasediminibacterium paludis TaxID=908966 RepID=A0ABV8PUH5_9BACT